MYPVQSLTWQSIAILAADCQLVYVTKYRLVCTFDFSIVFGWWLVSFSSVTVSCSKRSSNDREPAMEAIVSNQQISRYGRNL
jgi:hypothetical protein